MKKAFLIASTIGILGAGGVLVADLAARADDVSAESALAETGAEGNTLYRNALRGFSLQYPAEAAVSEFPHPEGAGDVVLFSHPASGFGVQLVMRPFDEPPESISPERIRQDASGFEVREPQELDLQGEGRGYAFRSGAGEAAVRHLWFVAHGTLFQLTAPAAFDSEVQKMFSTWRFDPVQDRS